METSDRIMAILACLKEGIAGIYTQKKLDKLDEEIGTQDWKDFVQEIKKIFSDKTKAADAEWKIKTFKQGKKNTADFMIKFETLAMKADTDDLHMIFTQEECITRYYQDNIRISTNCCTRVTQRMESGNNISQTRL